MFTFEFFLAALPYIVAIMIIVGVGLRLYRGLRTWLALPPLPLHYTSLDESKVNPK